jgi:uncharacterized protein (DUF58 family)
LFTDQVERYIPPKKGSAHVWRLIREIFTFQPEHTGTDIVEAVDFLARVCRKRTVAFLVSDFLTEDFGRTTTLRIRSAARKHELISVLVSDPGEFRLPDGGIVAFKDLETGETCATWTRPIGPPVNNTRPVGWRFTSGFCKPTRPWTWTASRCPRTAMRPMPW